ncbi:MAG TPA: GreA/GreB family elongation factor [Sedimentisphaerales bacterium]|nr:GreA/GreB family elongation factor [Sedimentisphaerales bacterium]
MVEEQVRHIVARAISATKIRSTRYYHVCCWQGRIQCLRAGHTTRTHPVFLTTTGDALTDGLSAQQWRVLTHRIIHICRMTGLTLNGLSAKSAGPSSSRSTPPEPQVTDLDCKRLQILLALARATQPETATLLERLQRLLESADVVSAEDVPADVVTMNSEVRVWNEDTARQMNMALVFPVDAHGSSVNRVRLSILSQIGMSMLGRKVGDVIDGSIRIDKLLYQPEAAGDFHL